jgi:hypothetical protein
MLSDIFVISGDLRYTHKEWHNRNKIRTANNSNGWIWLTVPVRNKPNDSICEVAIDNSKNWQLTHWRSMILNYCKTPFFKHYESFFEGIYSKKWEKLSDLNEAIIMYILKELDINIDIEIIHKSAHLSIEGKKTDFIIDLCKELDADTYLAGMGGRQYLEEQQFREENLTLLYQDFHHPIYYQRAEPFIPNISVVDLMFNLGNEKSRQIILKSGGMSPAGASNC